MTRHVVVVGGGAAGLLAAIAARDAGAAVTLVERTPDGGRKILISGGGRCNVLPATPAPDRFVSEAPPSVVRALLGAWPLREQVTFFQAALGVPLTLEPDSGKYFPASNRARDVRDALVARARATGVALRFGALVTAVAPVPAASADAAPAGAAWRVTTDRGPIDGDAVVLATGGLSVPATGSTGFGFDVAAALGHTVHPRYPALTPLTADPHPHADLAGISLDVALSAVSAREQAASRGGFLFTHRGYSGPAVLDVSHVAVRSLGTGAPAVVRVAWRSRGRAEWTAWLQSARGQIANALARELPERLAGRLLDDAGVPRDRFCVQLRREERAALVTALTAMPLAWTGHEGYRPAEVTGGGVALDEVHRTTLESRRVPGLHFCGEVLDAFGPIGGHNFQWAWSTGHTAGLGAARGRP